MARKADPRLDPGTPEYDRLVSAEHTRDRIKSFANPGGLICYWNANKVQTRIKALPESWQRKLWQYFENHLDFLNGTGPEGYVPNER